MRREITNRTGVKDHMIGLNMGCGLIRIFFSLAVEFKCGSAFKAETQKVILSGDNDSVSLNTSNC